MNDKIKFEREIEEGYTILDLLNTIKTNIILLLVICVGFVSIGIVYTLYMVTPMYTSSIDLQIYIEPSEASGTDSSKTTIVKQVSSNIAVYVKFPDIIKTVIVKNNLNYHWEDISDRITTTTLGDSAAVKINYQDSCPVQASLVVAKLVEELSRRINLESNDINSMKFASETVKPINYPIPDANQIPSSPNIVLNIVISLLLGTIAGVVVIILKEQLKKHFTSKKDVERYLDLPVVAVIPTIMFGDENV